MFASVFSSFLQALAREETLTNLNLKRKARLREELKEKEAAAALSDKSQ